MASWRLRQSYGFGAARLPLAPVYAPGPWSEREPLGEALANLAGELAELDARAFLRRGGLLLAAALLVALSVAWLVPFEEAPDRTAAEIVLLVPPPELVEPEPEPLPVEPEPEPEAVPLADAKPPPPPPPPALAKPAPPPKPEPVRAEPVRKPAPAPKLRIDAVAKAPEPAPVTPQRVERAAPARAAPPVRIDPVAPSFAVAATEPPAGQAAPLRLARAAPARTAPPVAFPLAPVRNAAPPPAPPPPAARAAPRSAPPRAPAAALPRFDPVAAPARYADAPAPAPPPPASRMARAAAKESAPAVAPRKGLQGVPLGSLAACVSDREEDSLKLEVMARVGARRDCSSRAGRYRFVETKNLNAFLMWIERNPSRRAADRCVELKLALECLAGTPNARTDKG
jgi:hypothetical protein